MHSPKYLVVEYSLGCSGYLPEAESVIPAVRDEIDRQIPEGTFDRKRFKDVSLCIQLISETELYPRVLRRAGGRVQATVNVQGKCIQALSPAERRVALCYALIAAVMLLVRREGGSTQLLEPIVERYARLPNGDSTLERLGVFPEPGQSTAPDGEEDEEAEEDDLFQPAEITIEYPIEGWGTQEDLQKRSALRCALARTLHQSSAGEVTGGEYGSGGVSIFIESDDPEHAVETIRDVLADWGLAEVATITVED